MQKRSSGDSTTIAEFKCVRGFISVNHKSMIYFHFTCLYEHNVNILCARIVRHLLCLLLFLALYPDNEPVEGNGKSCFFEDECKIYGYLKLSDGKLSKFRDFREKLYLLSMNLCMENIMRKGFFTDNKWHRRKRKRGKNGNILSQ